MVCLTGCWDDVMVFLISSKSLAQSAESCFGGQGSVVVVVGEGDEVQFVVAGGEEGVCVACV